MTLSNTRKDFLVSSKPPRKNPYLKAVNYVINYVIHGKLHDSQKTMWLTKNYVIHGAPVESTYKSVLCVWKTMWFMENYAIHGKLRDSRKTFCDSRKTTRVIKNS